MWDLAEGLPAIIEDGSTKDITGPGGLPIEQVGSDGSVLYYLQDQLGSTRGLTDSSGSIVATFTYDAYGTLTSSTGTATTPFGYAGQYTDSESGLQYLRARYYDPQTAQFLTVDPLVGLTQSPYGYTPGDPLNFDDPMGLWGIGDAGNFVHQHTGAVVVAGVVVVVVAGTACVLATVGICAGVELPAAAAVMGTASVAGTEAATVAEEDAGPAADTAATVAESCPGAVETDSTVLGRYPDYVDLAKSTGGRYLNVPIRAWNAMSRAEQWAANQRFLDRAIARGSTFVLASPPGDAVPGTFYYEELEYLFSRGYTVAPGGGRLIPPGG